MTQLPCHPFLPQCIRPLRAKHDPFSGYCVRRFDHYCPIVDNAVGEGNQGYFFMVLASMLTGQLLFLRLGWAYLERVAPIPREARHNFAHRRASARLL